MLLGSQLTKETSWNFQILDWDPASLGLDLELCISTKLPEGGDVAGPWLLLY